MAQEPGTELIEPYTGDSTDPLLRTDPGAVQAFIDNLEQQLEEDRSELDTYLDLLSRAKQKLSAARGIGTGETTITGETPEQIEKEIESLDEETDMQMYDMSDKEQQLREARRQLEILNRTP